MDDKAIFTKILGIHLPWFVKEVVDNDKEHQVDIYIDHEREIQVRCPEYDRFYAMYDHGPERIYHRLDACQMSTFIHVRPPRVNRPAHGVKLTLTGEQLNTFAMIVDRRALRAITGNSAKRSVPG